MSSAHRKHTDAAVGDGGRPLSRNELRKRLEGIPRELKRQDWQIQFLVEELRRATTQVERSVIQDWITEAKERRSAFERDLESCRTAYEGLGRRRGRAGRSASRAAADDRERHG